MGKKRIEKTPGQTFAEEFEKLGMGGKIVTIDIPVHNCATRGCPGKVTIGPIGIVAAQAPDGAASKMAVIFACARCFRLHLNDGSPLETKKSSEKVFLDRTTGWGFVKSRGGKIVRRFWTSRATEMS